VPNAKATVVYIPQIHKEPTSNANDSTNDQAAVIQKDIYNTLQSLVNDNHITYVMDETDLYGPMPKDKVEKIQSGLNDIKEFRSAMDTTLDHYVKDGGSETSAEQIRKNGEAQISKFERNMYLTGGAAMLAATNEDAHVYGSQNAATLDEARKELQDLVYMEQRINELQSSSNGSSSSQTSSSQSVVAQQMLGSLGSSSSSGNSGARISDVKAFATKNSDTELASEVDGTVAKFNKLSTSRSFETSSGSTQSASANVNPYKNATNLNQLKQQYDTAYAKFLKLAKDQRSQEVADNIEKEMQDNSQKSAVLVFGEQHKDQLVDALNKKGISVIVIMPQSEKEYLAKQGATAAVNS